MFWELCKYPNGYLHPYDKNAKVIVSAVSQYASEVNNLRITMYPKADLSIRLMRNQNNNYFLFDIIYQYSPTRIGIFSKSGNLTDTILNVETSANIYTKIEWTESYGFGQTTRFVDSIKCSPGNNNSFIINY
ncbi:MAG TPA: hypothetical protein PLS00_12040 [Niabella sp.]|nr:hypothetical protein [Agriterribacter sp.]HUN03580.1 hypothetical protein [Niabella sp.]